MIVGGIFNVFIMFPNAMTYPIACISIMGLYSHSHGICIKCLRPLVAKNFICLTKQSKYNCLCYIRNYVYSIMVLYIYIIDWHSLYRIKYRILTLKLT